MVKAAVPRLTPVLTVALDQTRARTCPLGRISSWLSCQPVLIAGCPSSVRIWPGPLGLNQSSIVVESLVVKNVSMFGVRM